MIKKAYIVIETGFEYNDEVYSEMDGENGTPVKVYTDRNKAMEEKNRLEREAFKNINLCDYAYDIGDLGGLSHTGMKKRLREIFGTNREKRLAQLTKEFSNHLEIGATPDDLLKAVNAAIDDEEFPPEDLLKAVNEAIDDDEDDSVTLTFLNNFKVPCTATNEQVDEVRAVFNNLSFFHVVETDLNS